MKLPPQHQDVKYIMDYFRSRPGKGWTWRTSYKRVFIDYHTYAPYGYKLRSIEMELRDSLRLQLILPAKRFEHEAMNLPFEPLVRAKDDICF